MSEIYSCKLTVRERLKIEKKLTNFEVKSNCHIWTGGNVTADRYGTFRIVFRGKRKRFSVHRLLFFMNVNHDLCQTFHVSHLCHTKLCLKFEHLSYEPKYINDSRKICKNNGECTGHGSHRKCILY